MSKTNKSRKRVSCLSDSPIRKLRKGIKTKRLDPTKLLADPHFIATAFFDALVDNDVEAALDAIDGYLIAIGKPDLAKRANLSPSTVYHALSKGANPTLKTLARILNATAA